MASVSGKMLTHQNVLFLLAGYSAAIQLDQIYVDTLPIERFHPYYDDGMWRRYRRRHVDLIDQLLSTVERMPQELLEELARLTISYIPAVVEDVIIDLFSFVATDESSAEEFGNATLFFNGLIKDVSHRAPELPFSDDASMLMEQWLVSNDPLRIARDPECGYDNLAVF
jgi:hypothetical protein